MVETEDDAIVALSSHGSYSIGSDGGIMLWVTHMNFTIPIKKHEFEIVKV